jgi:hypothetical protein
MADHRHEWDDAVMSGDLELAMAEFQRCIAERDVEAATVVLDADYALVLVQPVAAVVPKDRWLAALPDYIVHSYDVREQLVDVDGDGWSGSGTRRRSQRARCDPASPRRGTVTSGPRVRSAQRARRQIGVRVSVHKAAQLAHRNLG